MLGMMVDAWGEPHFLGLALVAFFLAMPVLRWRVAATIGASIGLLALLIFHVTLSAAEQAAMHFSGRILPVLVGGILISSVAWCLGRLIARLLRHSSLH